MTLFPNTSKKENLVQKVQNKEAFSLIEMIVVMAIILTLALLICPATIKVIKKGEQIQCTNNLKQLSYALAMYLQNYGTYPQSVRYAPSGEQGSLVDALAGYINNRHEIFVCPSTEEPFKLNELSYVYHEGIERNAANDWLLVCARLPESQNPHLGDRANILWIDGHVEGEVVEITEEE